MNLRLKILLTTILISTTLVCFFYYISTNRLSNDYNKIEDEQIQEKVQVINRAIQSELSEIDVFTHTLSASDETYRFVNKVNPSYLQLYLSGQNFNKGKANIICILNKSGEIIEEFAYDLNTNHYMVFPSDLYDYLKPDSRLLSIKDTKSKVAGLVNINEKVILLVSRPITTFDELGEIEGTLIVGRFLDELNLKSKVESGFNVTFFNNRDFNLDDNLLLHQNNLSIDGKISKEVIRPDTISGYTSIMNIEGKPALILRVDLFRNVKLLVENSNDFFLFASIGLGVIFCVFSYFFIDLIVVSRLSKLSKEVNRVTFNQKISESIKVIGDDELSKLSSDINVMLSKINNAQSLLIESERMATMGRTSSMVGHDLRNPLQTITLTSYILRKNLIGDSGIPNPFISNMVKNQLDTLDNQIFYMDKIVSNIQVYSGDQKPKLAKENILEIANDALKIIHISSIIKVNIRMNPSLPEIDVDKNMMQRVFINLILNAVQAMPTGGELVIAAEEKEKSIIVSIKDNGVGISDSNLPYLFVPLYTTKQKGMGLGLPATKRIIEAHGGDISIKSQIAVGTEVTFKIPTNLEKKIVRTPIALDHQARFEGK